MSSGPSNVTIARTMWVPFFFERIPLGLFFLVVAKCRICIFALSVVFAGRLWHSVVFRRKKGYACFGWTHQPYLFLGFAPASNSKAQILKMGGSMKD